MLENVKPTTLVRTKPANSNQNEKKSGAGLIWQSLVGLLLRTKQRRSDIDPGDSPTSNCEIRLTPDFFAFLKR